MAYRYLDISIWSYKDPDFTGVRLLHLVGKGTPHQSTIKSSRCMMQSFCLLKYFCSLQLLLWDGGEADAQQVLHPNRLCRRIHPAGQRNNHLLC